MDKDKTTAWRRIARWWAWFHLLVGVPGLAVGIAVPSQQLAIMSLLLIGIGWVWANLAKGKSA